MNASELDFDRETMESLMAIPPRKPRGWRTKATRASARRAREANEDVGGDDDASEDAIELELAEEWAKRFAATARRRGERAKAKAAKAEEGSRDAIRMGSVAKEISGRVAKEAMYGAENAKAIAEAEAEVSGAFDAWCDGRVAKYFPSVT